MPGNPRRHLFRRLRSLSGRERVLIAEAATSLALARFALVAIPFRVLAARLGRPSAVGAPTKRIVLTDQEAERVREVGRAVARAARHVPFDAACLAQAIAARAMLDRRGLASVVHFGVARREDRTIEAHAWLDAGELQVTGFPVATRFVEVAQFL